MMGDPGDCPKSGKCEKKGNPKHVKGNVVERRFTSTPIYSSWEELEANVKITSEATLDKEKRAIQPCPKIERL